ncbi:MAG: MFS transporter, partial [Armatimonadetes bacterium]|nr:MFS transporter [Armatimonadota bacterium]
MTGERRMSTRELLDISLNWFGLNFHWGALLAVVIPSEILRFVSEAEKGTRLAQVLAGGAAIAMVVMPLSGALSDRSQLAMGRRRPFMIAGGILNVAALLLLARAPVLAAFVLSYYLVQFSNNFGGSAYSGLIPDFVPPEQRGQASGWMGLMFGLGTVTAMVSAGLLMRDHRSVVYGLIIGVLLATLVFTVWRVHEARPTPV